MLRTVAHRIQCLVGLTSEWLRTVGAQWQGREPGNRALFFWVLVLAVAGINWAVLAGMPVVACLTRDSWGYVSTNTLRTQGYQLFLGGVVMAFGDLRWAVPVQLNAMLLSYVAVAFAIRRLFRSNLVGLATAAAFMFSAQMYEWYPRIMTEALFISLIGFHLAAVIYLLDGYTNRWAAAAGLTLGAMVLVRPNGVSFAAGLIVLAVLLPRCRCRVLLLGISPVLVALLAQATLNYHQQGFFGLSLFQGPQLVAKYGELVTRDMPTEYPEMAATLYERLRPLYDQYPTPNQRSFPFEYAEISSATVTPAQFEYSWPEMTAYVDRIMPQATYIARAVAVDRMATSLALSAVAHNPPALAKEVASSYIAYWTRHSVQDTLGGADLAARCYESSLQLIAETPESFSHVLDFAPYWREENNDAISRASATGPRAIDRPWQWLVRTLHFNYLMRVMVILVSTVSVLALIIKRPVGPALGLWAYLGVTLNSGFLVLSLINASFRRYAAPFDLLMILVLVTLLFALYDSSGPRSRRWTSHQGFENP